MGQGKAARAYASILLAPVSVGEPSCKNDSAFSPKRANSLIQEILAGHLNTHYSQLDLRAFTVTK
jgi:hypothetical protein